MCIVKPLPISASKCFLPKQHSFSIRNLIKYLRIFFSFHWSNSTHTQTHKHMNTHTRINQQLLQGSQGTNHHVTNNCQTTDGNGSNNGNLNGNGGAGTDEDVWRGHSIAALRRRASELNNSIPSYLHQNYDHHNSVYWVISVDVWANRLNEIDYTNLLAI